MMDVDALLAGNVCFTEAISIRDVLCLMMVANVAIVCYLKVKLSIL